MKTILAIAAISALAAGAIIAAANAQADSAATRQMQLAMNQTDFIERSVGGLNVTHSWSKIVMVPAGGSERMSVDCAEGGVPTGGGFTLGSPDLQVINSHAAAASTGIVGWAVTVNNNNATTAFPFAVDMICLSEAGASAATPEDNVPAPSNNEQSSETKVVITSDGKWSGAIEDSDFKMRTVDGSGDKTFPITCESGGIYSVTMQKMEESGKLTVAVVQGGNSLKQSSTTADFGVVSIAGTC